MKLRTILLCATALVLAGCETPTDFGRAVRHNVAADIVDPNAVRHDRPQTMEGARAELAQDRYVTGKTIVPEDPSTGAQAGSAGSGDSNSSGSSSSSSTSSGP